MFKIDADITFTYDLVYPLRSELSNSKTIYCVLLVPYSIECACYTGQIISLPSKQLHCILNQTSNFGKSTWMLLRHFKINISQTLLLICLSKPIISPNTTPVALNPAFTNSTNSSTTNHQIQAQSLRSHS